MVSDNSIYKSFDEKQCINIDYKGISLQWFPSKPRQKLSTNISEILYMNQYAHSSWNMSKNPSKTHTQNMDNWLIKETRRLSSAGKGFEWGIIEG